MGKINIGDKVQLEGGDPIMKVESLNSSSERGEVARCLWFDDHKHLQKGEFVVAILKKPGKEKAESFEPDHE